jgi:hypothetical protein
VVRRRCWDQREVVMVILFFCISGLEGHLRISYLESTTPHLHIEYVIYIYLIRIVTFAATTDRNDSHVRKSYTTPNPSSRIVHPETRRCAFSFPLSISQCCSPHQQSKDDLAYHLSAHLRLNAIYWGYTALAIMNHPDALDREQMIDFVMSCWDQEAGIVAFSLCSNLCRSPHPFWLLHS